jgi:hypothetical protein
LGGKIAGLKKPAFKLLVEFHRIIMEDPKKTPVARTLSGEAASEGLRRATITSRWTEETWLEGSRASGFASMTGVVNHSSDSIV